MVEVKAFAAIRYDERRLGGDLSAVLAPPYDVLDQGDKAALLARSPRNIVAVDLPHIPPKSAGPPEVYARAARLLDQWLVDGTLIKDSSPALYPYHQLFEHEGRSYTRRMLIARVRLQPFSAGGVLPHEKTFGGPKEDRLALMKATKCQLSPIFGLYSDPSDAVGSALASSTAESPPATGTLQGVQNRLWAVEDAAVIERVSRAMADKRIYIADGHHRYGTALMYREWLAQEAGARGGLPDDHPANFVMFVLAGMEDPGCLILPYYRALGGISVEALMRAWANGVRPAPESAASDLRLVDGATGKQAPVVFTRRDILNKLAPDEGAAWRKLDYAYLHRYLIDELLAKHVGRAPAVHYLKSKGDAIETARKESGVALLVNATPMAQLREVAESSGLMPQKSTYFFPKLATGLAINPLD